MCQRNARGSHGHGHVCFGAHAPGLGPDSAAAFAYRAYNALCIDRGNRLIAARPGDNALGVLRRQRRRQSGAVLAAHRKLNALRQIDALDGLRHGHGAAGRPALLCRGRHGGLAALQRLHLAVAGHGYRAALHTPADGCSGNGLLLGLLAQALLVVGISDFHLLALAGRKLDAFRQRDLRHGRAAGRQSQHRQRANGCCHFLFHLGFLLFGSILANILMTVHTRKNARIPKHFLVGKRCRQNLLCPSNAPSVLCRLSHPRFCIHCFPNTFRWVPEETGGSFLKMFRQG